MLYNRQAFIEYVITQTNAYENSIKTLPYSDVDKRKNITTLSSYVNNVIGCINNSENTKKFLIGLFTITANAINSSPQHNLYLLSLFTGIVNHLHAKNDFLLTQSKKNYREINAFEHNLQIALRQIYQIHIEILETDLTKIFQPLLQTQYYKKKCRRSVVNFLINLHKNPSELLKVQTSFDLGLIYEKGRQLGKALETYMIALHLLSTNEPTWKKTLESQISNVEQKISSQKQRSRVRAIPLHEFFLNSSNQEKERMMLRIGPSSKCSRHS